MPKQLADTRVQQPGSLLNEKEVWFAIQQEARRAVTEQPMMASFFHANVLNHSCFVDAVGFYLSSRLASDAVPGMMLRSVFNQAVQAEPALVKQMLKDLLAHYVRDAACDQYIIPLLYFKGFHALQSYRIAHWLWHQNRKLLAMYLQHRVAELFDVDIHPAAMLGSGIMLDHATGIVIGETSVIEDDVSMLHAVTLGGSGASGGKRHPTIGQGVLLSTGAKLLGDITIGECAKIGAGSVVLNDVPAHATFAGVPAKLIGKTQQEMPSFGMDHRIDS